MIDSSSRRIAAELLRQFAAGRLTNDEFADRWPQSLDPAVTVVRDAAWFLYGDLREYRLTGPDRLSRHVRRQVVRWVLFLHTDLPYEWPIATAIQNVARQLVTVLSLGAAARFWAGRLRACGEVEVWPFIRGADYRAALRRPKLLRDVGERTE